MVAREGERALVDFLREVLSHDLVAARKVENTAGIREKERKRGGWNAAPESFDDAEAKIGTKTVLRCGL